MKVKIILLFAKEWGMTDEDTGEVRQGVTCYYYTNPDMTSSINKDGSFGSQPGKSSIPIEVLSKIKSVPAVYEATFVMTMDKQSQKGVLMIDDLDYCYDINAVPVSKSAKAG